MIVDWYDVTVELPEKSGNYLVRLEPAYLQYAQYEVIHYSAKHKKFNAYDEIPARNAVTTVSHWAKIPFVDGTNDEEGWNFYG